MNTTTLRCGQFDEAYVDALKGWLLGNTSPTYKET
jgi:hypothetical protein